MPIMHDDQIDFERVVSDPEYRRDVILYLNERTDAGDRPHALTRTASVHSQPNASGPRRKFQQPANVALRKIG